MGWLVATPQEVSCLFSSMAELKRDGVSRNRCRARQGRGNTCSRHHELDLPWSLVPNQMNYSYQGQCHLTGTNTSQAHCMGDNANGSVCFLEIRARERAQDDD